MSNNLKFVGQITKVFEPKEGKTKNGNWKAVEFVATEKKEEYPQSVVFRLFGVEKVDNFLQYNKEGDFVEVSFNLRAVESKNGDRYFNSVDAWKVFKVKQDQEAPSVEQEDGEDDLPF